MRSEIIHHKFIIRMIFNTSTLINQIWWSSKYESRKIMYMPFYSCCYSGDHFKTLIRIIVTTVVSKVNIYLFIYLFSFGIEMLLIQRSCNTFESATFLSNKRMLNHSWAFDILLDILEPRQTPPAQWTSSYQHTIQRMLWLFSCGWTSAMALVVDEPQPSCYMVTHCVRNRSYK
jgi:hypothetical protein